MYVKAQVTVTVLKIQLKNAEQGLSGANSSLSSTTEGNQLAQDLLGAFKLISGLMVHISVLPKAWCHTLQKAPEKKKEDVNSIPHTNLKEGH